MKWWQETVLYEIYPKSFLDTRGQGTGTLEGIRAKLDYLASLGVGALWLTPVYPSPLRDNGYDIADYCAIDPRFGTLDEMDALIADARARGIRIVMDLVLNHTSDEHPWFVESSSSRDNPKSDWYIWADPKPDGSAPTNWRGIFGKPAWTWCEARGQYYLHSFCDFQPDLNWENPAVRRALFDVGRFWLDRGVGGFRLDAVMYLKKPAFVDGVVDGADGMADVEIATANTEGLLDFWGEFRRKVMDGTDAFTVAEAKGVPWAEMDRWVGPRGVFDMILDFNHILVPMGSDQALMDFRDWKITELKAALSNIEASLGDFGWFAIYFENHDKTRLVDEFFPPEADKRRAARAMAVVTMTLRGTPFIYQGQELGMTNVHWSSIDDYDDVVSINMYERALAEGHGAEEALRSIHAFSRDNARTPMQWSAGENAGFTTGEPWLAVNENHRSINVESEEADPASTLHWYRRLAALRREHPALIEGSYEELIPEHPQIYAYRRRVAEEEIIVAVNLSCEEAICDPALFRGGSWLLTSDDKPRPGRLRGLEAVVARIEPGDGKSPH